MRTLRARVKKGRLVMNEPTDLPEGTVKDLVFADEVVAKDLSEMNATDRRRLEQGIDESIEQGRRGLTVSARESVRRVRARR